MPEITNYYRDISFFKDKIELELGHFESFDIENSLGNLLDLPLSKRSFTYTWFSPWVCEKYTDKIYVDRFILFYFILGKLLEEDWSKKGIGSSVCISKLEKFEGLLFNFEFTFNQGCVRWMHISPRRFSLGSSE